MHKSHAAFAAALVTVASIIVAAPVRAQSTLTGDLTLFSAPVSGQGGSSATGDCTGLINSTWTMATFDCNVTGGRPFTDLELWSGDPAAGGRLVTTFPAGDAQQVQFPYPPGVIAFDLPTGNAFIQGRNDAGTAEFLGAFIVSTDTTVINVPMDGGQMVPPTVTADTGNCDVIFGGFPDPLDGPPAEFFFGIECTGYPLDTQFAHLHAGARGENGPISIDFVDQVRLGEEAWSDGILIRLADLEAAAALRQRLDDGSAYLDWEAAPFVGIRGQIDGCAETMTQVCLHEGRFQVSVEVTTQGGTQSAELSGLTPSIVWFQYVSDDGEPRRGGGGFVDDRCDVNGHYAVHANPSRDRVDVTVVDLETGQTRTYTAFPGDIIDDPMAFPCTP